MRMMVTVQVPVQRGSQAIKDGTLPRIIQGIVERTRPECAYFYLENGLRTMRAVFDMKEGQDMVPTFEPALMELDARVELTPVLVAAELTAGFAALK